MKSESRNWLSIHSWWHEHTENYGFGKTCIRFAVAVLRFLQDSSPSRKRQRYGDVDYDWDHRVDTTAATVGWRERLLGTLYSPYQPTDATLFHEMIGGLQIDFREFAFIDLGSGKGRALLMASDYPFRRILGVELLAKLHQIAEVNIAAYRKNGLACSNIKSLCADARDFGFPPEPTVLYLFNPLPAAGLSTVLGRLGESLQRRPRPLFVLYHNPEHEHLFASCAFLRKAGGTHQYSLYVAN